MSFEDFMDKMPVIGSFTRSDEEKALVKKQREMAEEARRQLEQSRQTSMQALGQSMLAFNPQNQMMAQMFGPQAAFSPQQMAQMSADPAGGPQADQWIMDAVARGEAEMPAAQWMNERGPGRNASGKDGERAAQQLSAIQAHARAMKEYEEKRRKLEGAFSPLPQGPAPIQQTQAAPGRRY
jgi:hypothetical protein